MNRWSSLLLTAVFCLIMAGGATSITLAHAGSKRTAAVHQLPSASPTPSATPLPSSTPSATPTPTPVATPLSTPTQRTAVTNGFVHMRVGKSTSSAIVVDLQAGSTVVLGSDETSLWQESTFGSYHGYIWKSYLNY
jgi:hypothetical protein